MIGIVKTPMSLHLTILYLWWEKKHARASVNSTVVRPTRFIEYSTDKNSSVCFICIRLERFSPYMSCRMILNLA